MSDSAYSRCKLVSSKFISNSLYPRANTLNPSIANVFKTSKKSSGIDDLLDNSWIFSGDPLMYKNYLSEIVEF